MTRIAIHFASGDAFFTGLLLWVGALVCARRPLRWSADWRRRPVVAFYGVGALVVAASATPLPFWLYAVGGLISLFWLGTELRSSKPRLSTVLRGCFLIVVATWCVWEIRFRFPPALSGPAKPVLVVIGDSISAGMEEGEAVPWPIVFSKQYSVEVVSLAQMGATVRSALRQAEKIPEGPAVVLLEIGGNDLLGSTSLTEFEERLDELLKAVCRPDRLVVMMELPLPPLGNAFGRAQRRQAAKHGVALIPKRLFANAFGGEGATLDGLHLTQSGHDRFAMALSQWLTPVLQRR